MRKVMVAVSLMVACSNAEVGITREGERVCVSCVLSETVAPPSSDEYHPNQCDPYIRGVYYTDGGVTCLNGLEYSTCGGKTEPCCFGGVCRIGAHCYGETNGLGVCIPDDMRCGDVGQSCCPWPPYCGAGTSCSGGLCL